MLRSLHMKLVLVLTLLIISLMAVVGTFLMGGITRFYLNEFGERMREAFRGNAEFVTELTEAAASEDAPYRLNGVLGAYGGLLGIDTQQRHYFVLDGATGAYITGSNDELGRSLSITRSIITAMSGSPGYTTSNTLPYFDAAVPIGEYIVYIYDNKRSLGAWTNEMFVILLQSLLFGIVISVFLSFLLSKTMTTPIESLTRRAEQIASGSYEPGGTESTEVSRDEIGTLTTTFDHMASVLRKTIEAMENERGKLDTLFLHMADGVAAFTKDGALLHINPAARRMLPESGTGGYSVMFGGLLALDEALALAPTQFIERELRRDGRIFQISFALFGGSEETEGGVMTVIHDVTERMHMEDVRREFVANVSHELRTPLTNIKGYAETMLLTPDIPAETIAQFTQVITNEADRMTRIVSDLLTLSRFDNEKMDWRVGSVDIAVLTGEIYEASRLQAQKHGHRMTLELVSMPPVIQGDRERLAQVFSNVISNAIKYTPDGGEIDILVDSEPGAVTVIVRDNGIGVPQEDIPRLFERFYRVDKARSRASGGTGLGLAIAKEIVERHHGEIELKPRQGHGLEVVIKLPA